MFRFDELPKAMVLAWTILVFAGLANAQSSARVDDDKKSPTPPGLYVTPTALANAVQQPLNPGLTNYPNFVAGQAVKAVVRMRVEGIADTDGKKGPPPAFSSGKSRQPHAVGRPEALFL
jgi:hypothetical protein